MDSTEIFSHVMFIPGLLYEARLLSWPIFFISLLVFFKYKRRPIVNFYTAIALIWWVMFLIGLILSASLLLSCFFVGDDPASAIALYTGALVSLPLEICWGLMLFLKPKNNLSLIDNK